MGSDIVASIQTLHEMCHRVGTRTVALAVPPSAASVQQGEWEDRRTDVNQRLQEFTESCEMSTYVDTGEFLPYSDDNGFWDRDGLHLSRQGSQQLGESLSPLLTPLLPKNEPACVQGC